MTNVIYKEVRAGKNIAWQQYAEAHASNGVSFVVRPFSKELHWAFLDDLRERFDLSVTFNALTRSAFFDKAQPRPESESLSNNRVG